MKIEIITNDGDNTVTRIYAKNGVIIHGFSLEIDEDNAMYSASAIEMQPTIANLPQTVTMTLCEVMYKETEWHSGS